MRRVDREALRRALRTLKAKEPDRRHQLKGDWEEVAKFAAYSLQCDALDLRPWEEPPCYADADKPNDGAWVLRRQLLAGGLSIWEPNPLAALANIAARQRGDAPPVIVEPSSVE